MTGDDQIIAARKRGVRPSHVWLMVDCGRALSVGDVLLTDRDKRPDLRFIIGLDVTVIAETWTDQIARLWESVKAAKPAFAILAVLSWGEDIGLKWMPGKPDTPVGEGW